jgi:hypothetical protein
MLAGSYGKDFAEAVHKTPAGQFTNVIKTTTFGSNGYTFAKVEGRRETPAPKPDPKNPKAPPPPAPVTDPKKITEELTQQRASEKLGAEFKQAFKDAKVVFKPEGAEEQAYYDYAKVEALQSQADQARMMAQFGQPTDEKIPTPAEIEEQRAKVNAELEALAAKHPDDSTLALLVAKNLKTKLDVAPADQKAQLRERLITLYQTVLKSIEDRNVRFDLAELYRDKGDKENAFAVYQKTSHLMDIAPGFDTQTLTEEQAARKRLVTGFRAIDKSAEADAEQAKLAKIEVKLAEERRKAAEQSKAQMPGTSVAPGKSSKASITMPAPKPSTQTK